VPQFRTNTPHPVQLALWGDSSPSEVSAESCAGTVFDVAKISISDSSEYDRPRIASKLSINGSDRPVSRYPVFREFRKNKIVDDLLSFEKLPTRARKCPHCRIGLTASEWYDSGKEEGGRAAGQLLEYCPNCTFWQVHGFRMQGYEARSALYYDFDVAVLSSKVREFETDTPDGSLVEISQWLRRHPEKYQTMSPHYLEKLVTRVFADVDPYVEAHHVGRPGDGGVDVLLIDSDQKSWLVQVKRRADAHSNEPVSAIRNVLGSMVLEGFKNSIIVSTADRFTHEAQRAADRAKAKGFEIELVDRRALDRIIGKSLSVAPWWSVQEEMRKGDVKWVNEEWCFCGCMYKGQQ